MYLRARDASFALNFVKGYLGIWVQMLLVTSFGVMFSTFLSGPVAMMATLAALVPGSSRSSCLDVAAGQTRTAAGRSSRSSASSRSRTSPRRWSRACAPRVVQTLDAVLHVLHGVPAQPAARLSPLQQRRLRGPRLRHSADTLLTCSSFPRLGYVAAGVCHRILLPARPREVAR